MSYATLQDLIDRFGETEILQLSDRENLGTIDQAVVARALADATAEIDGYVSSRRTLPLPAVPPALVRIACSLARYHLHVAPSETVKTRYDDAIRFLKDYARGQVSLGDETPAAPAEEPNKVLVSAPDRLFPNSLLDRF